jgi:hypothetical protein
MLIAPAGPAATATRAKQSKLKVRAQPSRAVAVGRVIFTCPITHRETDSGILMDPLSLARLGGYNTRFRCHACDCLHEARLAEARLLSLCLPADGLVAEAPT